MSRNKLIGSLQNVPELVKNTVRMNVPNSVLPIYTGIFILKNESHEFNVIGKIYFKWFPRKGVFFSCTPADKSNNVYDYILINEHYSLLINNREFGRCFISKTKIEIGSDEINMIGQLNKESVKGDKSINVNLLRFSIPNLREFDGQPIKRITNKRIVTYRGRISLDNGIYKIIIDKSIDFQDRYELLKMKGGYFTLYAGEISKYKGNISFIESKDIINCLNSFLGFVNGRRTSAFFINGIINNKSAWHDYTNYQVDPYKYVHSCLPKFESNNINDLWNNFSLKWKNENDQDFLKIVIHWYVEANSQSGYIEGSTIMAQTALELIYNYWIIEKRKIVIGRDAENLNADNKIRLLLSQFNISCEIPKSLDCLLSYKSKNKEIKDGPSMIIKLRNAIVHSQENKRKDLKSISNDIRYQTLELALWYIELSILGILEYDDKYSNRCSLSRIHSDMDIMVPWSTKHLMTPSFLNNFVPK